MDFLDVKSVQKIFSGLMREVQVESITLMGGEPLLYPHLTDLIELLCGFEISVGIATNGTLLGTDKIKELIEAGVSSFEISVDTLNPDHLEFMTGFASADRLKKVMLEIKKQNCFLALNCVLSQINKGDVGTLIETASAFSADRVLLSPLVAMGNASCHWELLNLTRDEICGVFGIADEFALSCGQKVVVGYPCPDCVISHQDYPHLEFGTCLCGDSKWLINARGELKTCEFSEEILGSLFKKTFSELMESDWVREFRKKNLKPYCNGCQKKNICSGGCRFIKV